MTAPEKNDIEKDLTDFVANSACGNGAIQNDEPLEHSVSDDCCRDELLLYVGRKYGVHIPDALIHGDMGLSMGGLVDVIHSTAKARSSQQRGH